MRLRAVDFLEAPAETRRPDVALAAARERLVRMRAGGEEAQEARPGRVRRLR